MSDQEGAGPGRPDSADVPAGGVDPGPAPKPPVPAPGETPQPEQAGQAEVVASRSGQTDLDIRATIEAAEVAAEEIRRDAEERATAHLRAARERADRLTTDRVRSIAAVTDELIGQAATIRAHSEELAGALRRATETLTRASESPALTAPSPTAISATGIHEDAPLGAPTGDLDPDGPEYRARQLAAAGASRRTIAIVLRREFNVEPMAILERLLG